MGTVFMPPHTPTTGCQQQQHEMGVALLTYGPASAAASVCRLHQLHEAGDTRDNTGVHDPAEAFQYGCTWGVRLSSV